jgi:mono/diheme cytochrome c family protein
MPRFPRSFPFLVLVLALPCTGCGKPAEPAAPQAAAVGVPNTPAHMQEHFAKVREVEEAIIVGDIAAARTPALWLADHQPTTGFPAATERPLTEMKAAARTVATTRDIQEAAMGAANLVGSCGRCHSAAKVEPKVPPAAEVVARKGQSEHMLDHQSAVNLLYRGLIVPVSGDWIRGAEALKTAELGARDRKGMTPEALAAEARVHELADQAVKAPDQRTRITLYGSIIGSCAGCHGLHGRVLGTAPAKSPA